eukprot:TRINITY_DN1170_c0_g1_i1.p1 TRINITY_DN1170_c0_g1~~TRINITY_DN1170_c0_g1_i1.p1  ORF type:complete len:108 (-),score=13.23 TRINITY_DN1170_c0_g1_i1:1556-1879(-)
MLRQKELRLTTLTHCKHRTDRHCSLILEGLGKALWFWNNFGELKNGRKRQRRLSRVELSQLERITRTAQTTSRKQKEREITEQSFDFSAGFLFSGGEVEEEKTQNTV